MGRRTTLPVPPNAVGQGSSRQDLVLNSLLQLVGILHELEHFLFALMLGEDLSEVLTEDLGALVAE